MLRAIKIAVIVIGSLILILIGFQLWLNSKAKTLITDKIHEATNGLYVAETSKVRISLIGRSLRMRNITLVPDSTAINSALPHIVLNLSIDNFALSSISLSSLFGKGDLNIGKMHLVGPHIIADIYEKPDSADKGDITDIFNTGDTPNPGRGLDIRSIIIENGDVELRRHQGNKIDVTLISGIDSRIDGFESNNKQTNKDLKLCDRVEFSASSIRNINPNETIVIEADSLNISPCTMDISVGAIRVIPQYTKEEYALKDPEHKDWTRITAGRINCYGTDIRSYLKDKKLYIDSIDIASAEIASYKNRNIAQAPVYKKLFFEWMQTLPLKLSVPKVKIGPTDVTYWEIAEGENESGVIHFTNLTGYFLGLTNIPTSEPYYQLVAGGTVFGAGKLHATFYLPVEEKTNRFEVQGTLGPLNLLSLNPMIVPLANAEIKDGRINSMNFHIAGTTTRSEVKLTMLYDDLEVALLRKNDDTKERKFISWIANEFVIKDRNPDNIGTREGGGWTERDTNRSQFNYLWRSLLPGIKGTVGL